MPSNSISNIIFSITLILCGFSAVGQYTLNERMAMEEGALATTESLSIFKLLKDSPASIQAKNALTDYTLYALESSAVRHLSKEKMDHLKIELPFEEGNLKLNLIKSDILAPDFKLRKASNPKEEVSYHIGALYWGKVEGVKNSIVTLSIYKNEVVGIISIEDKTYNLGKLEDEDYHILYEDVSLSQVPGIPCFTDDVAHYKGNGFSVDAHRMDESNCVGMYVETAYDMFQAEGSVAAVTDFVTAVFNEVAILYANESINLYINELLVWDVSDPYSASNPSGYLNDFMTELGGNFNGDLAHLLSYDVAGGVAYLDVLCNSNFGYGFSGVFSSYNTVPTYSWTVEVITHEIGHNLGSPHTHACAWNGNNTAIDGCGPAAGYSEGCDAALPDAGTIMSYCHLVSGVGINFNLGFGSQPGDLIRSEVYNASCLTSCVDCDTAGDPCDDGDPCTIGDTVNGLCECQGQYTDADNDGFCIADDPDDTNPCIPVECPPCTNVTITINLDNYPEETTWDIVDASGNSVESGGPYGNQPDGSTVTVVVCLEDGCYDFTIYDSYGDGICCGYGNGSYVVTDADGNVLASGGEFENSDTTNFCLDNAEGCDMEGMPCDDNDSCTTGETYDADCLCNGGVYQDADGDGTCDAEDLCDNGPEPGTACNDNDPSTVNDVITENCECVGTTDEDFCPGLGLFIGDACDDGDACTEGDTVNANCECVGTYLDSDEDGVCDAEDLCDNGPEPGTACNDNNVCTINDVIDENCNCVGIFQDADGDGTCDAEDVCADGPEPGSPCDDGDACTLEDVITSNCDCSGTYTDADADGFCAGEDPDDNNPCVPDGSGPDCEEECVEVVSSDFEQGWDGWISSGSDASRVTSNYAYSGDYCLRLRDNSNTSMTSSESIDLSTASEVNISFTYIAISMDNSEEDFWLQLSTDGGVSYSTVEEWNANDEFINGVREFENVTLTGSFSSNTRFRFRCDASSNYDWVYIDDIVIEACSGGGSEPTCNDGMQNGTETGVDCGGAMCPPCENEGCAEVNENDFEQGWGIWNDGGSDAVRSSNYSEYAYSGDYCVRLRDNSNSSYMTTANLDLSSFNQAQVSFTYITESMDNANEDFWLQLSTNGGATFTTVEEWNLGDEFENGVREFENVLVEGPFTANTKFRFRCDASSNADWVYLDDVLLEGCVNNDNLVAPPLLSTLVEDNITLDVEVYPNPSVAGQKTYLNIECLAENVRLDLYDILGNLIFSETIEKAQYNKYFFESRNIPQGTYYLKLDSGDRTITEKILLLR